MVIQCGPLNRPNMTAKIRLWTFDAYEGTLNSVNDKLQGQISSSRVKLNYSSIKPRKNPTRRRFRYYVNLCFLPGTKLRGCRLVNSNEHKSK